MPIHSFCLTALADSSRTCSYILSSGGINDFQGSVYPGESGAPLVLDQKL